ncbi:MAG: porphobilinogen synthase [Vicinamibacterales bacterium]
MSFPTERPRRIRQNPVLRRLTRETRLTPDNFIVPLFVCHEDAVRRDIPGMPGCHVLSVDGIVEEARALATLGVSGLMLFGVPNAKDEEGSSAHDPDGPVPRALRALKEQALPLSLWADVCLCEYTSHGHCGVLTRRHGLADVDNDRTLPLLERASVAYAAAGADVIAPSDMMDGRVGAIRRALDGAGHADAVICSYAVKYASAFYGPFREAAQSRPAMGNRRGYQMDPANAREALREVALDIEEGADMVMVKPALAYLDVICRVKEQVSVPVAAYNVSGEYAMIKAAGEHGFIDGTQAALEVLLAIRRAGADVILTYFAREIVPLLD